MIRPVIYWTDALLFTIVILIIYQSYQVLKDPLRREVFLSIFKKPRYSIALLVLSIFGGIAILDSLHFSTSQHGYHTQSVLDALLSPWNTEQEKTYSAPLAKKSFVPELLKNAEGVIEEIYPPLLYPGKHWLGTDKVGRDIGYISLKSIRTGLVIGTVTTLIMLPFALLFGMWAGYFGGIVDDIIQYIYTTLNSVPGVLLIAAAVVALQTKIEGNLDARLLLLCIILGVTSWTGLCRLLRGETLKLRETEFVQAAITLGQKPLTLIHKHILPNLMHIIIITSVLDFSGLVLAEAVLSYIGVGVDPSTYSFGNMINAARLEMARDPIVWWSLTAALVMMFTLVFSANIVSDAIQDALSPRRRYS